MAAPLARGIHFSGPSPARSCQRIVTPLIRMGSVFGVIGILVPALSAAHGNAADTGFVLAAISLGGTLGALAYSFAKVRWALGARHAALGMVFGTPLLLGFAAGKPWTLGILLAVAGLAVTPPYINAYLMMDAEIRDCA